MEPHLLEKIDKMNNSGVKKPVKTWSRRSMVTPDFVDPALASRLILPVRVEIAVLRLSRSCNSTDLVRV